MNALRGVLGHERGSVLPAARRLAVEHQRADQGERREGLEPAEALRQLNRFVSETCDSGTKATFVGHVAVFDWMYVCWYYAWCGLENPFGYKGIDTKSLAMGVLGLSWDRTGKETILPQLGVAPQAESTLHRADADAQHQAELFVALMRRSRLAP